MAITGNNYLNRLTPPAAGFTLVELMIGMALASIVMLAIYTSFQMQHDTYIAQEQVVTMQQDLRASMESFSQDVRLAGYDPSRAVGAGFTTANATTVRMTMDIHNGVSDDDDDGDGMVGDADDRIDEPDEIGNNDGDVLERDEDVTYNFDTVNNELDRTVSYGAGPTVETRTVAQNVQQVEFLYTLADGTTDLAPANLANIRGVELSILVSGGNPSKDEVGTQNFTSGSGAAWTCPTGERCRMLDIFVQCRNMGL